MAFGQQPPDTAGKSEPPPAPIQDRGKVSIATDPVGATVILDGAESGVTPLSLDSIQAGKHAVSLKLEGYYIKKGDITIIADTLNTFEFTLVKPASLVITSTPVGASLAINGKESGVTPYENRKIKPGDLAIVLSAAGYDTLRQTMAVSSGQSDTLRLALKKTEGPIVQAAPSGPKKASRTGKIIILSAFLLFGLGIILAEFMAP
jgi:hypothetical protein